MDRGPLVRPGVGMGWWDKAALRLKYLPISPIMMSFHCLLENGPCHPGNMTSNSVQDPTRGRAYQRKGGSDRHCHLGSGQGERQHCHCFQKPVSGCPFQVHLLQIFSWFYFLSQ